MKGALKKSPQICDRIMYRKDNCWNWRDTCRKLECHKEITSIFVPVSALLPSFSFYCFLIRCLRLFSRFWKIMGMISRIAGSIKRLQDVKEHDITLRWLHISLSTYLSASIFLFISNFCHLIIKRGCHGIEKIPGLCKPLDSLCTREEKLRAV